MKISEKIRTFLTKLQNLPDNKKKIILCTIVIILAVVMGFFWVKEAMYNFSKIGESTKSIEMPSIGTLEMPSTDILQNTTPSN